MYVGSSGSNLIFEGGELVSFFGGGRTGSNVTVCLKVKFKYQ